MLRALALILCLAPALAAAAPQSYRLDAAASEVRFEVDFGTDIITGRMPVSDAAMVLDFAAPAASRVAVTLDATRAEAAFPFATQALRGPTVLNTGQFPDIRFETTAFRAEPGPGARASVDGTLTIRGVSRPVTLDAEIFRQQGRAAGDLSALSVDMRTAVSRAAFDAAGWDDLVGDEVRIRILARIERAD